MRLNIFIIGGALSLFSCNSIQEKDEVQDNPNHPTEVVFHSSDNVRVYADIYWTDSASTTIIMGHQGGSNSRAEYKRIIPALIEQGFNVMTIDFRKGGQLYGKFNRTISHLEFSDYSYCDAYFDLLAAMDYLDSSGVQTLKILWGSSFSGALVLKYSAEHERDDLLGILAFSPASGEPMGDCNSTEFLDQIPYPTLIIRPLKESKIPSVIEQLELADKYGHQTYVAQNGVHGASLLDSIRIKGNTRQNWDVVKNFLKQLTSL